MPGTSSYPPVQLPLSGSTTPTVIARTLDPHARATEWVQALETVYAETEPSSQCPLLYPYWAMRLPSLYRSVNPPARRFVGDSGDGERVATAHFKHPGAKVVDELLDNERTLVGRREGAAGGSGEFTQYRSELYSHCRLVDGSIAIAPKIAATEPMPPPVPPPSSLPALHLFNDRLPPPPPTPFPSRLNPPVPPRVPPAAPQARGDRVSRGCSST